MINLLEENDRVELASVLGRYIATKFLVSALTSDEYLSYAQIATTFDEFVGDITKSLHYYYSRFFKDQRDEDEDRGMSFLEDIKEDAKEFVDSIF